MTTSSLMCCLAHAAKKQSMYSMQEDKPSQALIAHAGLMLTRIEIKSKRSDNTHVFADLCRYWKYRAEQRGHNLYQAPQTVSDCSVLECVCLQPLSTMACCFAPVTWTLCSTLDCQPKVMLFPENLRPEKEVKRQQHSSGARKQNLTR